MPIQQRLEAARIELAPEVSVNGVSPGTVLPPEGTSAKLAARWAAETPLKRNGRAEEVAEAVVFLCTGPSFMTGQILRVDGGKSLSAVLTFSKPGTYLLFCPLKDRDGGKPHFLEGMIKKVTIG